MITVYTCKGCGCDNPKGASICNGCGRRLEGLFSAGHYVRWVCPNCSRVNMMDNKNCLCGTKRSATGGEEFFGFVFWGCVLFFILSIIFGK